jgi:hypothetical protein
MTKSSITTKNTTEIKSQDSGKTNNVEAKNMNLKNTAKTNDDDKKTDKKTNNNKKKKR